MPETTTIPGAVAHLPATAPDTTHTPGMYPRAWAYWAAGTALSFTVLETAAYRTGPGRTLSAQLRRRRAISALTIAAGACWLVHHVVWDGSET